MSVPYWISAVYFVAAVLFIFGLKAMSSPVTARRGIVWAGAAMALATIVTFWHPQVAGNVVLIIVAMFIGSIMAWISGKRVAMTDMPQMIALYNGMGGGAAAAIAAVELLKHHAHGPVVMALGVSGALIGTIAFSGSLIAFAKLQGWMRKVWRFPGQQFFNLLIFGATLVLGVMIGLGTQDWTLVAIFYALALVFGVLMTVPIGGADMPVVISLYNALTGLAVGFEGFVLGMPAMMIAGIVVGAAGTLLTQLMAKAMNRPISNVLFSGFGTGDDGAAVDGPGGTMKAMAPEDAAILMAYAERVIIVPGYGMAVAQAQHKIWELVQLLDQRGVKVSFAIHPVAGRMPGHMNVLLAEAGVPYDVIYDLEDINAQFPNTDVALVIGANDVVNPAARDDPSSPIHGMPILNVDQSRNVIVIKRGQGTGFSGIENRLFVGDNTQMLFGDAQKVAQALVSGVKTL
ncbi:MAG: NAD(P)(+) transhydrogenase (Re/Si-specific) subunit beta [Wenzhouxiangellaceae bacterium]